MTVEAVAPGRVNLIGDHTDTTGGLVLPMAIDLATTVRAERGGDVVHLTSSAQDAPAIVPIADLDLADVEPGWARYVAGVVAQVQPATGLVGTVDSTLPLGGGLSSSASLEVAVALALGFRGSPLALAELCQRAEQAASGVPCGIMDQLAIAAGVAGHALRIDCHDRTVEPVAMPDGVDVVVISSGEERTLVGSPYAQRRAQLDAVERQIGPLRALRDLTALAPVDDDLLRRRARHVITENVRVDDAVVALRAGDVAAFGERMVESHASLRDDFEVSTPALDLLVERLVATPGVHGARLTGAGFGGCVVALTAPDVLDEGWHVEASGAAGIREEHTR